MVTTDDMLRGKRGQGLALVLTLAAMLLSGCARMGQPDGGWYDETPPKIVSTSPQDLSVQVTSKKIHINFDEYIKLDNPSEKIVVSPPQIEMPEIKGQGKRIVVELKDSLQANTTYTIDFSDAISDNNEGNPLGNYTYTFSTGTAIDTLQVAGYVLESENLEPIKGILVGLYSDLSDSAFVDKPMQRVSRTDSRGHFVIKGVAAGEYKVYALMDADGDYKFSQKAEKLAFHGKTIVPECFADIRQDTVWRDSLRIDNIKRVGYTHFVPDNVVLKAFTEQQTDRFLVKAERKDADCLKLFFSHGDGALPAIKGLNFDAQASLCLEANARADSLTYWVRDSLTYNQDTLDIQLTYMVTDSAGVLRQQVDTLELVTPNTYAKRQKQYEKEYEEWKKRQERAKRNGESHQEQFPQKPLNVNYLVGQAIAPDSRLLIEAARPLAHLDSTKIHLYQKRDTLWYKTPFQLVELKKHAENQLARRIEMKVDWRPDTEYSLEIDSLAFVDVLGGISKRHKQGFKVRALSDFAVVKVDLQGMGDENIVVQLLNKNDAVVKETFASKAYAEFKYVLPGDYYLRLFVDTNQNGVWDTGDFRAGRQAEEVYYFPEMLTCKANWDVLRHWDPNRTEGFRQKPQEITRQKPERERKLKQRNLERARKLGIDYAKTLKL